MGAMMELKTPIACSLYLSTLLFSGHALALSYPPLEGELHASGSIIEAACSIDSLHRDELIEFGDLSARDIRADGEEITIRPFMVRLTGCTALDMGDGLIRYPYASVTFTGDTFAEDATALATSGNAKGFGIRLQDHNGETLTFGKASSEYTMISEKNILRFTASLVPVQENIQAGDFYATARFFMDYN